MALRSLAYTHTRVPDAYERGFFEAEFGRIQKALMPRVTRTVTVATTQQVNDWVVLVDCTAGAVTFTLLSAALAPPVPLTIKKIDASANAVTVAATIDGAASPTLAAQYKSMTVVSDGSAWYKIASI